MGRSRGKRNWLTDFLSDLFFPPNVPEMKARQDAVGLIDLLEYPRYEVRRQAELALSELGSAAVEPLIARLQEETPVRALIARLLAQVTDGRCVAPLIGLLKDRSSGMRQLAAHALGKYDTQPAIEALCEALAEDDADLRQTAMEALEKRANAYAVAPLIRAAQSPKASVHIQTILRLVLDRAAATVSTEDLRRAAQMNDSYVLIFSQMSTSCSFTSYYNGPSEPCDFTQIKQMARQELLRRGLEA